MMNTTKMKFNVSAYFHLIFSIDEKKNHSQVQMIGTPHWADNLLLNIDVNFFSMLVLIEYYWSVFIDLWSNIIV